MTKVNEAKVEGDKIYLNGWFRMVLGIVISFIGATTAYAFIVILPTMSGYIIENDHLSRQRDIEISKDVMQNRILIAEIVSIKGELSIIKENQNEFKQILKRTAPYERK